MTEITSARSEEPFFTDIRRVQFQTKDKKAETLR